MEDNDLLYFFYVKIAQSKPSEEDNNPLCSPAANSVLDMGYSKVKVQYAIDKFVAEKGMFYLMTIFVATCFHVELHNTSTSVSVVMC